MAKLTGPLHSLSAAGGIGNTVLFQGSATGAIARRFFSPSNPRTAAQTARRIAYQSAVADWHALTAEEKSQWKEAGKARHITGFNAFLSATLPHGVPATGTTWDGGATTWDGGTTTWD